MTLQKLIKNNRINSCLLAVRDEQPIKITLLDENDEIPHFVNEPVPFLATVQSSAPPGTSVYHLLATDKDEGADIEYSLESGINLFLNSVIL